MDELGWADVPCPHIGAILPTIASTPLEWLCRLAKHVYGFPEEVRIYVNGQNLYDLLPLPLDHAR